MLGGIYHDQKNKKTVHAAFVIARGVWENLRYYGD